MGTLGAGQGGLAAHKALIKNKMLVDSTSSAISGQLDNLSRNIKAVEAEIKADEDGKAEYENVIRRLEARKRDLEKRIGGDAWPGARPRRPPQSQTATAPSPRAVANQDWINTYEKDLGPFKDKYHALVKEIEQLYGSAKDKHAKGIQMLVNEFDYHVAYKRWSDSFTAVPFKPS